ncbi:unnamed protein product [Rotaria sordida]|uniref:RNA-directed DNA polymerase n=1 Tax=Rotaria sordida TaxID=392033 RepID=A0A819B278_9BILA|nr:unnamed protein product [Rotaria sordida]
MSAGDVPTQISPITNYDSADSSSSTSLFNRSSIPIGLSPPSNTQSIPISIEQTSFVLNAANDEHISISNPKIHFLEEKINNQNATIYHQQSELKYLHKSIRDLSNEINQLKLAVNSPSTSPISHSRPTSAYNCINNDYLHDRLTTRSSHSPILCVPQASQTCIPQPTHTNSFYYSHAANENEQIRHLQDLLTQANAALERHNNEIDYLKKENDELRYAPARSSKISQNVTTPSSQITQPSSQPSHTSAFVPIVSSSQAAPATIPTNAFTSTPIMPFTMSLTNTLPNFSGKENEMPTKFITEFELRASGIFGYHDEYLLRAVQQALSDTALTWFIQQQQALSITTWNQFKQLFLQRFRTPDKIESLRGRLRILWQNDNESTADYFERLKALISEIEPVNSTDYLKRKFLQKLRKDIRDKMPLGLTSSLSDLVQKAIEIETNIVQQKIDDKLRDAHKEDNIHKQKSNIINNLRNGSQFNSLPLSNYNGHSSNDNNYNNSKSNNNFNDNSRTFINSNRSPPQATQMHNDSYTSRQIVNRHKKVKFRNNNKWCSSCSSANHTWLNCYSNPNGLNYQSTPYRREQQQHSRQQSMLPPHYSQQHHSTQQYHQPPNQHEFINQQQPQQHYQQPSSSSYLPSQSEAKINDIPGVVLLDTGSGLTIINSRHWSLIGDQSIPPTPYDGADIHGPEGSSIRPIGWVEVKINIAGVIIQHKAVLAANFEHLILLGNDFMKNIGLVLDIQANKMWLRSQPDITYSISSDLTNMDRIDIPLLSTQLRTIPPFHIAFIQVHTPSSISSEAWQASVTGVRRHVVAANSLVRIKNQCCLIQVANCSSKAQVICPGQHLAVADLYDDDINNDTSTLSCYNSSTNMFITIPSDRDNKNIVQFNFNDTSNLSDDKLFDSTLPIIQPSTIYSLHSNVTSDASPLSDHDHSSKIDSVDFLTDLDLTDTDITLSQAEQLKSVLAKYHKCFDDKQGCTSLVQHHIDTGNTKPIKLRPYRVSPHRKEIISNEIIKMLNAGIIEPCSGPYAAPITLQPKKDGSLRFCIDYRELNAVTIRDVYPIPRIDDTLDQLQYAKYFSSMDLRSGFWQIALDPDSRDKTAFISHAGLFRFRVMPFGLTNAPATFQRLMDLVLGGLKWSCALVYLDDIIVYSSSFEDHLNHLELVLQQLHNSGLTLKINKCHFCKTHLKYLGHIVSKEGIQPDPDQLRAVREYPVPTKLKAVRSFLGLTSYYRRFIKNYATIAEPLLALTRNSDSKSFQWTQACQDAFELLRQRLIEAPIISYPRFDQPFILQLDASDVGISAILAQKLVDNDNVTREHVIAYASRTLSSTERKYNATERECLAIIYGCNYYRPYLEGTRFTAVTDHKALKWLHSTKDLNTRLARWAIQIAAYDMDIQHRPGSENGPPDALSRYPINVTADDDIESSSIICPISSNFHDTNYNGFLSSIPSDPGSLLLLDYFRQNSLPPNSLSIPLSLPSITGSPSHSTIANLHFADNINFYEQIRAAQWNDSSLLPLLNFLQHQIIPTVDNINKFYGLARLHRVIDGALYRTFRTHSSSQGQESIIPLSSERILLVIPASEVLRVMQLAHDHATAAHLGRRKTLSRLLSRVYWPHMRRDVANYVRSCILCQQYKPTNQKPGGLMKPIIVSEPWHTVGIDITGPLPKTRRGNRFILVVVDYFTKWVELFPLQSTKASIIAQLFLDEVICRFGFPVRVISDNGVQFLSKIFIQLCNALGIHHQRTPLYHPQSNLSERINRTLKPILASLAHYDSKSWDLKLSQIAFALRTAPSESTDNSPAFLMFGRHPRQPLDLLLPPPAVSDNLPSSEDLSAYRQRLLTDLLPAYTTARELLDISHQTQARNYNVHRRSLEFEPDDLVWVTTLSGIAMGKWRGSKMQPRREGPYKIITKLSSVTYELEHIISHHRLSPIHIERLTPYYSFTTINDVNQ